MFIIFCCQIIVFDWHLHYVKIYLKEQRTYEVFFEKCFNFINQFVRVYALWQIFFILKSSLSFFKAVCEVIWLGFGSCFGILTDFI